MTERLDAIAQAIDDSAMLRTDARGYPRLVTTPPIERVSMVPKPWHVVKEHAPEQGKRKRWYYVANRRRIVLLMLALAQTWLATSLMSEVLPYHGTRPLEIVILVLFAVLFTWVSLGFWTAMAGLLVLIGRRERFALSRSAAGNEPLDPAGRTAIVMPIRNEDVARVFAGLRATYESLAQAGELAHFDFFVLSDTSDADTRVAEVAAWERLCRDTGGLGRIFYRWRTHRIKRKSGNIADFCRRWGNRYRYMVVLDADSVMSGTCLATLVRLANAHPDAGIIQTAPRATGRDTLFARIQQFATRMYGPLFTAGLHYWQLGESHYWGHNAIIRVAPFIEFCALAPAARHGRVVGRDPVARLRRGGVDAPRGMGRVDRVRRRRQLRGDAAQPHRRAVARPALVPGQSHERAAHAHARPASGASRRVHDRRDGVSVGAAVVPVPRAVDGAARAAHAGRAGVLHAAEPALSDLAALAARMGVEPRGRHGAAPVPAQGDERAARAAARGAQVRGRSEAAWRASPARVLVSALLAPIRMLFHTRFVVAALLGRAVGWKSPSREDAQTSWAEALQRHGVQTAFGMAWIGLVYWLDPAFVWWLAPVAGALALSIPLVGVHEPRVARRACAARGPVPDSRGDEPAARDRRDAALHAGSAARRDVDRRRRRPVLQRHDGGVRRAAPGAAAGGARGAAHARRARVVGGTGRAQRRREEHAPQATATPCASCTGACGRSTAIHPTWLAARNAGSVPRSELRSPPPEGA